VYCPNRAMGLRVGASSCIGSVSSGSTHILIRDLCCWKWHSSRLEKNNLYKDWCQTKSLLLTSVFPIQQVFAGCHQSLLGDGPSRRYLCNPCMVAWTPTLQAARRYNYAFSVKDFGPAPGSTSSARQIIPVMQLQQGLKSRGSGHSIMFRPHAR